MGDNLRISGILCTFAKSNTNPYNLMKKAILTYILFSLSAICAFAQRQVYVCTGDGAYRYHYYRNCSGLNNCKATIVKKSLEEAKSMPNITGLCKKCEKKSLIAKNEYADTIQFFADVMQEKVDSCYTCMLWRKEVAKIK